MEVEGFRVLFKTIRYALFLFDKSARNLTWRINGEKKININVRKKDCINRNCPSDVFCKKSCTDFFFGKFRGNHQYRSFFFHKVVVEHLQMVAPVLIKILYF